ncbi:methyl-accepting chemotaxis protein [Granulosicoccus antarcticus]|uniref:Methyl-accepting chemotaxis protein IV n=1 Tax=Granulosicoccus antarcticus IMCC3135 TaxID=1192854 RepID=A0A2Z2NVM4_9GAMM|nr:methyl-accepting chemotaxis protein [Granulosicoccus antarcticus]ASJ73778.1 Methyl-accepting chemotaxis protein IV [Granulosicoccus antarcticus IMCC3135]
MRIFKNGSSLIKWAIGSMVILLVVLMACKPRVDMEFNTAYIENIDTMQELTGQLLRDHLLVSQGLVKHYDYLEADLEMMGRSAQLAKFVPTYVGPEYRDKSVDYLDQYSAAIVRLREQIEKSKRSIGLLQNAKMAFKLYLDDLNSVAAESDDLQVRKLLNELNHALVYSDIQASWLDKLEQVEQLLPMAAVSIQPLSLHARMLLKQQHQSTSSSKQIYAELKQLKQPDLLKKAFVNQYVVTVNLISTLSWGINGVVVGLLMLCVYLTITSHRAQEYAQRCALVAQKAQADSEQRVEETKLAVLQCNKLLAKISKGDFGHRLENPFDEELELLRTGINQTADSVEFIMLELTRVMLAIQEGRFDVRLDSQVQGDFGQQVDQTIATLDSTIGNICRVMDDMRDGCFGTRVEASCSGRLQELKHSINSSMIVMEDAISAVVEVAEDQSQGNFSRQIQVNGKGQFEQLAHSINATSSKVHEMVQQIRQVSRTVSLSSDSMQSNSHQLWEHTNSHSDSVAQLLGKVDLVRASIQTNQDSVQQANSLVDRSRQAADNGTVIANQAIDFMDNIAEKSQKIAKITQVLDTIARQTNLLALNAAVEAARAKEHGSGFSVVANEVKELARQSTEASTLITTLIQATATDIQLGSESVENTGRALQAIAQSISDVEQAASTIVAESHQQEKGMDTIVQIISKSRVVMDSDLKLADTNRDTCESLGELAHRVNELLDFFQSGESEVVSDQSCSPWPSADSTGTKVSKAA